ncbi:ankyrin repeat domain-containing protein [Wolbachia endosymbiont (group A) of Ennomos erosarius]|uniref:ankyrin repeat domain-containing protein n=1 Tax=Wolbachia endosymbiont (group A) of Ennomos erosarius TaxID=3066174 RepID=UPI003341802E
MEHEQWKEILGAVNEEEGLSKDNVIARIKEKLEVKDKNEYEKWENAGFSVNHLFQLTFCRKAEEYTLLYLAAKRGHTKIVKILIEKGANVNVIGKGGLTPLYWAVQEGRTEIVKILIAKGAKVDAAGKDGFTPLHWAVQKGRAEMVKILIENGADHLIKDVYGCTPMDIYGNGCIIQFLREKAFKKSVIYGGSTAVLGGAIAIALFAAGTIAVELIPIVIAVATVAIATLAVGGITYMMSKPSTKVDEAEGKNTVGNGLGVTR